MELICGFLRYSVYHIHQGPFSTVEAWVGASGDRRCLNLNMNASGKTRTRAELQLLETFRRLVACSFPKKCASCNRVYSDLQDFVARTRALSQSGGLLEQLDDAARDVIDLNRNCACGSTLMVVISERRDISDAGKALRRDFQRALDDMTAGGVDAKYARRHLLDLMLPRNKTRPGQDG